MPRTTTDRLRRDDELAQQAAEGARDKLEEMRVKFSAQCKQVEAFEHSARTARQALVAALLAEAGVSPEADNGDPQ